MIMMFTSFCVDGWEDGSRGRCSMAYLALPQTVWPCGRLLGASLLLRGRHELVASNSRPSVGNGRTEIGMCGASNAHQVQRRTAKLSPDWLKDSATTTLHPLGRVVSNPVLPKLLAAVHISRSRPVRPPPADTQCAVSNEPSTPEAAHRRPAPTSPLGLPRLRNPRSTAPQPYLCVVRRGGCPHRVLRGWSSTACR